MIRRRLGLVFAAAVLASLVVPTGASAGIVPPPSYYPSGPQVNVDESVPLAGGWTVCWSGTYDQSSSVLADVLAACDQDYLLLASGPSASTQFDVLAAAPRAAVITDTGSSNSSNTPTDANGTGWYFSPTWSWGFAPQGASIYRDSCDYGDSLDFSGPWSPDRLCWHTNGNVDGGWRSGSNINAGAGYRRVIMESSGGAPPGPGLAIGPTSGPGGAKATVKLKPGKSATLNLYVGNPDQGDDYFQLKSRHVDAIKGPVPPPSWNRFLVTYYRGNQNITKPMQQGTYLTPLLASGEQIVIKVRIELREDALRGVKRTWRIVSTNDSGTGQRVGDVELEVVSR